MDDRLSSGGRRNCRVRKAINNGPKLAGCSQPSMILTTGLEWYVVKFRDFTGRRGLMCEVVGTELMATLGLPVPHWVPVELTSGFIQAHPEIRWRKHNDDVGTPPTPGLHFGSRVVESQKGSPTVQRLPSKWLNQVRNREDFVGALLVDLWTNNCDRGQCVYARHGKDAFDAVFIDHGHMFGGDLGTDKSHPGMALARDVHVYGGVWREPVISRWKSAIDSLDEACLADILSRVPSTWTTLLDLQQVKAQLLDRRRRLGSWIMDITSILKTGHFSSFNRVQEALEPRLSANDCGVRKEIDGAALQK